MQKGLSAVLLLLALSLTAVAHAAPAEDVPLENLSEDRADTIFDNVFDDNASSTTKDESTSILARGTSINAITISARGTSSNAITNRYPSSGQCGLQVNRPHASATYSEEIHTRITSFCRVLPLVSNTVSGKTYRSRWYGWQRRATLLPKTVYAPRAQNYRRTVVAKCKEGTWYRYRTEGFGTISTGVQRFSAAVYEQQDRGQEIRCERR